MKQSIFSQTPPTDIDTTPPTGIDTVMLQMPFRIRDEAPNVKVCKHSSKDVFLWYEQNRPITGVMGCLKTEFCNVRISPIRTVKGVRKPWGPTVLWMTFSVPRVATGSNAGVATRGQFEKAINSIQEWLLEEGIEVDLWRAKLVRIDISRNFRMDNPLCEYMPILHQSHMRHERYHRTYPTGFTAGNKSQLIRVYDKKAEIYERTQKQGKIPDRVLQSQERILGRGAVACGAVARVEWGLRKAKAVQKYTGFETVLDLYAGYDTLPRLLNSTISKHLFRDDVEVAKIISAECQFSSHLTAPKSENAPRRNNKKDDLPTLNDLRTVIDTLRFLDLQQSLDKRYSFATTVGRLLTSLQLQLLASRQLQTKERQDRYLDVHLQLKAVFKAVYGDKKGTEKYHSLRTRHRRMSLQIPFYQNGVLKRGARIYRELSNAMLNESPGVGLLAAVAVPLPLPEASQGLGREPFKTSILDRREAA